MNGYGYFRDDLEAVQYAQSVGKNQMQRWKRYGIVPKALVKMFSRYFTSVGKANLVYRDLRYGDFLTLLMRGPYKNELGRYVCEKFYHDLLIAEMPWLESSFASADYIYREMARQ